MRSDPLNVFVPSKVSLERVLPQTTFRGHGPSPHVHITDSALALIFIEHCM